MKQNKKLWWMAGTLVVLLTIVALAVIRYVPWHKLVKVPTASEKAFLQKVILNARVPNTLSFDFEVDSTQEIPKGIYEGTAHSGKYSAKAFGKNAFSVSVVRTAGEIGLDHLDGVGMSAWVYVFPSDNEVNGSLVFSATNSVGVNICWKGIHLSGPLIPTEQWTKISGYFSLSDVRLRSDDKIQLYFWNDSDTKILVDDFYFVFGAPHERLGASTLVDLTGGQAYQPRFNHPPFRTELLQPDVPIVNEDDPLLSPETGSIPTGIYPGDRVVAGHFITPAGTRESLLVIKASGNPELYHYCLDLLRFVSVPLSLPDGCPSLPGNFALLTGSFLGNGYDQVFIAGQQGQAMISFAPQAQVCSGRDVNPVPLKLVWENTSQLLADLPLDAPNRCTAANLTTGQATNLILFDRNGSWKILRFDASATGSGTWQTLATGAEFPVREWDLSLVDYSVYAAPFLPGYSQDLLLTIVKDLKTEVRRYTLMKYDPAGPKFVRLYPDKQGSCGLTIGFDTLKTTDHFYPGHFRKATPLTALRYNRDRRFDLKEIAFTDSAFTILRAIDFSMADPDHNPKFSEELELATGNWINPEITSVLVMTRNGSGRQNPNQPAPADSLHQPARKLQLFSLSPKTPQP